MRIAERSGLVVRGQAVVRLWGPRRAIAGVRPPWWPKSMPLLAMVKEEIVHNLITDGGLDYIADQLADTPVLAALSHMELGRDGTAPAPGQTTVLDPIAGSRLVLSEVPVATGPVLRYVGLWDRGVATDPVVAEAADFNAPAAGLMIGRFTFGPFDKDADSVLSIERTWTFARV